MTPFPNARAADVGYGHVKLSTGRAENGDIRTDSFASQSPLSSASAFDTGVMHRRDTFLVPVEGRTYEVGHGVGMALGANHESEVLDQDFALSDPYKARLLGALNYMRPHLPDRNVIGSLVLGLPLTTIDRHAKAVANRYAGQHQINTKGDTITVERCYVFPQPLGAYTYYLSIAQPSGKIPKALVVDPGYNTVDWFVCQGMTANGPRSKAVERGMSAVLRAVAEEIIKRNGIDAGVTELVRALDHALTTSSPFSVYGKPLEISEYLQAGIPIMDEAAQAVKNSIGSGSDIDVILLAGGGASLYKDSISRKFPHHQVVVLKDPAVANVKGFQILAENLERSACRATGPKSHG